MIVYGAVFLMVKHRAPSGRAGGVTGSAIGTITGTSCALAAGAIIMLQNSKKSNPINVLINSTIAQNTPRPCADLCAPYVT